MRRFRLYSWGRSGHQARRILSAPIRFPSYPSLNIFGPALFSLPVVHVYMWFAFVSLCCCVAPSRSPIFFPCFLLHSLLPLCLLKECLPAHVRACVREREFANPFRLLFVFLFFLLFYLRLSFFKLLLFLCRVLYIPSNFFVFSSAFKGLDLFPPTSLPIIASLSPLFSPAVVQVWQSKRPLLDMHKKRTERRRALPSYACGISRTRSPSSFHVCVSPPSLSVAVSCLSCSDVLVFTACGELDGRRCFLAQGELG